MNLSNYEFLVEESRSGHGRYFTDLLYGLRIESIDLKEKNWIAIVRDTLTDRVYTVSMVIDENNNIKSKDCSCDYLTNEKYQHKRECIHNLAVLYLLYTCLISYDDSSSLKETLCSGTVSLVALLALF